MTIIYESGYTLPPGDQPLTHARICHANNWFAGGTITASTTDADYFTDAPDNSLTYEKWKPTALPATWETDLGSSETVDYCAIAAHDLAASGCDLQVQYWDGAAWQDVIPTTTILDDGPILAIFEPQTAQRWRIRISNGVNPTIGVVRFGEALQMPQPIYGGHSPLEFGRQVTMKSNISETGEFVGRTMLRTQLTSSFSWTHLTANWVRANWGVFQRAMELEAFFIAWRPASFGEVGYCQTETPAIPRNMGIKSYMEVELQVRGHSHD